MRRKPFLTDLVISESLLNYGKTKQAYLNKFVAENPHPFLVAQVLDKWKMESLTFGIVDS